MGNALSNNSSSSPQYNQQTPRSDRSSRGARRTSTLRNIKAATTNTPTRATSSSNAVRLCLRKNLDHDTYLLQASLAGRHVDNTLELEDAVICLRSITFGNSTPLTYQSSTTTQPATTTDFTDLEALTKSIKTHLKATNPACSRQTFKAIKAIKAIGQDKMMDISDGSTLGVLGHASANEALYYKAYAIAAQDFRNAMNTVRATRSEIDQLIHLLVTKEIKSQFTAKVPEDVCNTITKLVSTELLPKEIRSLRTGLLTRLSKNTESIIKLYDVNRLDYLTYVSTARYFQPDSNRLDSTAR